MKYSFIHLFQVARPAEHMTTPYVIITYMRKLLRGYQVFAFTINGARFYDGDYFRRHFGTVYTAREKWPCFYHYCSRPLRNRGYNRIDRAVIASAIYSHHKILSYASDCAAVNYLRRTVSKIPHQIFSDLNYFCSIPITTGLYTRNVHLPGPVVLFSDPLKEGRDSTL